MDQDHWSELNSPGPSSYCVHPISGISGPSADQSRTFPRMHACFIVSEWKWERENTKRRMDGLSTQIDLFIYIYTRNQNHHTISDWFCGAKSIEIVETRESKWRRPEDAPNYSPSSLRGPTARLLASWRKCLAPEIEWKGIHQFWFQVFVPCQLVRSKTQRLQNEYCSVLLNPFESPRWMEFSLGDACG